MNLYAKSLDWLHCVLKLGSFECTVSKIPLLDGGTTLSVPPLFYLREQLQLVCCWCGKNMLLGFWPKSNLCSLFILCFFSWLLSRWFSPKARSPDSPSTTFASQYIELDGLIPPSPSAGQLTEHKQWQAHLGICGTQPQGENWGEISCSSP